ncbi:hypothetical protein TNCT_291461 [Trichonephila clavata]|uniref:Integrase catalytic domain-containing protein n=1 Tax=Trichonephila clavata TaxID=2740835 RepID=A0A8X6KGI8_TRICU|nr:hypothetical protein TNCT_291461 [Trichonephila clavata]
MKRTTVYHTASNGMIERWHRQLKSAIKCLATEKWVELYQQLCLGFNVASRGFKVFCRRTCIWKYSSFIGKKSVILVDRLKPAFMEIEDPVQFTRTNPVQTSTTTRYGRCERFEYTIILHQRKSSSLAATGSMCLLL